MKTWIQQFLMSGIAMTCVIIPVQENLACLECNQIV